MTINNRRMLAAASSFAAASFLVVHLLQWVFPNVFIPWNAQVIDRLFQLRSNLAAYHPPYDSAIVHVDITDRTIAKLRNVYVTRTQIARVVDNLATMGVAAQAWDFIFPGRANDGGDSMLIANVARAGNVYFGLAFDARRQDKNNAQPIIDEASRAYLDAKGWKITPKGPSDQMLLAIRPLLTYPDLAFATRGLGFLNVKFDRDGVFRRAPLLLQYNDALYPSFPFLVACDYLGVTPDRVEVDPGISVTLRQARYPNGEGRDLIIPIDEQGMMLVNFTGPWDRMKHYDFGDVFSASDDMMELEDWADELGGCIAIVSQVTTGSADVGPVPADNNFPLSGVHANVINTILTGATLREVSPLTMGAMQLLLLVALILLSTRLRSLSFFVSAFALLVVYLGAVTFMFLEWRLIVQVVTPSLTLIVGTIAMLTYQYLQEEKEKESLRRSFEAYFPPTVVQRIMNNPSAVTHGGQKKELTILFSDIKSFTSYSSTMPPDAIQQMLNEYFEAMVEIVFEYQGTVDKFIGDGLMVFFGDPEQQEDHALRCVRAAIAMQKKTRALRARWEREGRMPIEIRIGINTGVVVVGNMGSSRRLSYTVLGSEVNMAQRLESSAPVGGILISRRTYECIQDRIATLAREPILVKGIDTPVQVYEVPIPSDL